ncbi:MAG TPA: class I SAM-dependent methyltransferase [Gaiellaceae bacterium]|jgi:SAM-dependent methyltransferase
MTSKAERFAALQAARAGALAARLDRLLVLRGDERALDVGTGTGALAFALAPRVASVTAVDADPAMIERARASAPANVEVTVADGERLPFADASFDLAGTLRTLHHTARPDRLVADLARVVRPGGALLVADQLAPAEPAGAERLNRFEQARDPSTTTVLGEAELRALLAANGLTVEREELVREPRDLDAYLDLAGCEGAAREHARSLAPPGYEALLGWFSLRK